jgi:hypothetical protein
MACNSPAAVLMRKKWLFETIGDDYCLLGGALIDFRKK